MLLFDTRTDDKAADVCAVNGSNAELINAASYKYFKQYFNTLEPQRHYHFWTGGQWSMHDLLAFLLTLTGPADCWVSTYAISEDAIRRMVHFKSLGLLTDVHFLFDFSAKEQKTSALMMARENFNVALTSMHAKTLLLMNDKINLVVSGSANWTRNPKAERQMLCTCRNIVELDKNILSRIFNGEHIFKVR